MLFNKVQRSYVHVIIYRFCRVEKCEEFVNLIIVVIPYPRSHVGVDKLACMIIVHVQLFAGNLHVHVHLLSLEINIL